MSFTKFSPSLGLLITFAVFVLSGLNTAYAQTSPDFAWAREIAASVSTALDGGNAVAVGSQDNIVVTGRLDENFVIAKYSPTGNLLWSEQLSATKFDEILGLTVDASDNIYVTGSFQSTITFASGQANELSLTSEAGENMFTAKYDATGLFLWATRAGGTGNIYSEGITIDSSGNPLVIGDFSLTATFGPGELNQTVLVSAGGKDVFIAKLNTATGELIWVKKVGGISNDQGTSIEADSDGGFVVAGGFMDTVVFGAGETNETTYQAGLDNNLFIAKYDDQARLVWAKQATGNFVILSTPSLAVAANGDIFVFSGYADTVTFAPGEPNAVSLTNIGPVDTALVKYDTQGQLIWVRSLTGNSHVNAFDVTVDSQGNSTVAGSFLNNIVINSGEPDEQTLIGNLNIHNSYIVQYSSIGDLVFAKQVDQGTTGFSLTRGIAHDSADNVVMTGVFGGSVVFGSDILTSSHGMFTAKLGDTLPPTREPVILVPGIVGSKLNRDDGTLEEIWPRAQELVDSFEDDFLDELKILQSGQPDPLHPIKATDIIRMEEVEKFNINFEFIYLDSLIKELINNGYEEGTDLFVFPYDWRLNIEDTAVLLDQKVDEVLAQTGASKVDIVAHSQGGLVSKLYASNTSSVNIDQLILVGVPQLGAPKAFKALNYGDNMGFEFATFNILNPQRVKTITQNMPAIYQLLPSRDYLNFPGGGAYVVDFTGNSQGELLDYDKTTEFLIPDPNDSRRSILNQADQFHQSLDNISSLNTEVYQIVGCGNEDTIGSFNVYANDKVNIFSTNGDGTVPFISAVGSGLTVDKSYYVLSQAAAFNHTDLVRKPEPIQQIINILNNDFDSPVSSISQSVSDCFTEQQSVTRYLFSTHSPVNLHIFDSSNNHVGATTTGDIDLQIPNSRFEQILDNDFAFVPPDDIYRLFIEATSTGLFDLKIRTLRGTTTQDLITYVNVPIDSPSSTAELFFTNATGTLTLTLDQDGDGIRETQIQPTAILSDPTSIDITPPTTTAMLTGDQ